VFRFVRLLAHSDGSHTSIYKKLSQKSEQLLSVANEDSPNVPGLLGVCNKHLEDVKGLVLDALGGRPQQVHHKHKLPFRLDVLEHHVNVSLL
jgi:hypothetical protein